MARYSDNLFRLRELFDMGNRLSLDELAMSLGLSTRHARRLIRKLRHHGVPVKEQRKGRIKIFYVPPEYRNVRTESFRFNEEQVLALAVAAEAAKAALQDTPMGAPLGEAFNQLLDRLAPDVYTFEMEEQPARWHFDAHASGRFDPQVFQTIQRAINESRSVKIDYVAASTGEWTNNRKIDPLQLARYGGTWAVVAWCHLRQDMRDFALSGIDRVQPCDPKAEIAFFCPPKSFDPEVYFHDRFSALSGNSLHTVRLLVESDRSVYFQRKRYHHSQHIEAETDGRIIVSYRVQGLAEMRSFAQSWGIGVTVLEPSELVEIIAAEAVLLANRYSTLGA